jgi:hypothetical protein
MLLAACNVSDYRYSFQGHCQGRKNILFDTEQGRYDAAINNSRVVRLCQLTEQPENFDTYSLRSLNTFERIEFIEYIIRNSEKLGFIEIDGIRDLVTSINDEAQATDIVTKLMQWTEDYDCHINVVLHLNKGEESVLRGHLGTEIQNKAESIIEVEKHKKIKGISIIKAKDFRGIEFEDFAMRIDENGLPYIDNDYKDEEINKPDF